MTPLKVRFSRRCLCSGGCYATFCAGCGEKLSSHDFTEEESRRFAASEDHVCRVKASAS